MEKIYTGKTKDVYKINDNENMLIFKDDMTGKDGVFDPGANSVGLTVDGAGYHGLLMSKYYFEKFEENGVKTHYLSCDLDKGSMNVKNVTFLGKGIEVICRFIATGSFIRRYGAYMADGTKLTGYVEVSLKDDDRGDPFIDKELLNLFGIITPEEYDIICKETLRISNIIKDDLAAKGLTLYDLKLEFGKDSDGNIILIDELSGGNMRVYDKDTSLDPISLAKRIVLG